MTTITDRFMKAGIPRSCWGLKCEETGRGAINTWAAALKEKAAERGALLSAYVLIPADTDRKESDRFAAGQEYVELLARQAVVKDQSVCLVPFYKLLHTLENPARTQDDEDYESVVSVLVVPYVPTPEQATCTPYQYALVIDHLLSHIYEGGALVIGGSQSISKRLQSRYPAALERMLVENSEMFGV